MACGISLHWYAELIPRPHRAQKDACTTLVSSEKPAHLRQKMREIEPNLKFFAFFFAAIVIEA